MAGATKLLASVSHGNGLFLMIRTAVETIFVMSTASLATGGSRDSRGFPSCASLCLLFCVCVCVWGHGEVGQAASHFGGQSEEQLVCDKRPCSVFREKPSSDPRWSWIQSLPTTISYSG